jgi:hypothetical protein
MPARRGDGDRRGRRTPLAHERRKDGGTPNPPRRRRPDPRDSLASGTGGGLGPRLRLPRSGIQKSSLSVAEAPTPFRDITGYNNFYELGLDKTDPSRNAGPCGRVPGP